MGAFVETGTITIGPQTNTEIDSRGVGAILAFDATFTIDSLFPPATVTGSKTLAPTAPTVPTLADASAAASRTAATRRPPCSR